MEGSAPKGAKRGCVFIGGIAVRLAMHNAASVSQQVRRHGMKDAKVYSISQDMLTDPNQLLTDPNQPTLFCDSYSGLLRDAVQDREESRRLIEDSAGQLRLR